MDRQEAVMELSDGARNVLCEANRQIQRQREERKSAAAKRYIPLVHPDQERTVERSFPARPVGSGDASESGDLS